MSYFLLALLALLAVAFLVLRNRDESAPNPRQPAVARKAGTTQYHCVGVKCARKNACDAVLALEGKRFLPDEAPTLPLPECTVDDCSCAYLHYEDRRHGRRRSGDVGLSNRQYDGRERRGRERRRDLGEDEGPYDVTDYFNQ